MGEELKNTLNDQFTLLNLMRLYLIDKKTMLINNGIERIYDGEEIYKYELKKKETEFKNSVKNDFNLMIQYCLDFKMKPLEERKTIQGFERIYSDFYSNLYLYINHNEKEVKKMLKQTFKNFAKNDFSD